MVEEEIIKYGLPVIYKITNPSNSIYIGQSRNWISRKSKYKKLRCKGQLGIYRSLLKYGIDLHLIEIIETLHIDITQEELNNREIYHWKYYKDLGFSMLNIQEPGSNGVPSIETKLKMKIAHSGKNNAMHGKFGKDHPAYGKVGYLKGRAKELHPRFGSCGELNPNFGRVGKKHPMFGIRKGDHHCAKKVVDISTNITYPSAKDAAEILGINYSTLRCYLQGRYKNRTSLQYL